MCESALERTELAAEQFWLANFKKLPIQKKTFRCFANLISEKQLQDSKLEAKMYTSKARTGEPTTTITRIS